MMLKALLIAVLTFLIPLTAYAAYPQSDVPDAPPPGAVQNTDSDDPGDDPASAAMMNQDETPEEPANMPAPPSAQAP